MKRDPLRHWEGIIKPAVREKILRGKVPALVYDAASAPVKPGETIVLEWASGRDTETGDQFNYPVKTIKIQTLHSSADRKVWIATYCPPDGALAFMRRGGGTTPDRFASIDREVELDRRPPDPYKEQANDYQREHRRLEAEVASYERRIATTSNEITKARLIVKAQRCRDTLSNMESRAA